MTSEVRERRRGVAEPNGSDDQSFRDERVAAPRSAAARLYLRRFATSYVGSRSRAVSGVDLRRYRGQLAAASTYISLSTHGFSDRRRVDLETALQLLTAVTAPVTIPSVHADERSSIGRRERGRPRQLFGESLARLTLVALHIASATRAESRRRSAKSAVLSRRFERGRLHVLHGSARSRVRRGSLLALLGIAAVEWNRRRLQGHQARVPIRTSDSRRGERALGTQPNGDQLYAEPEPDPAERSRDRRHQRARDRSARLRARPRPPQRVGRPPQSLHSAGGHIEVSSAQRPRIGRDRARLKSFISCSSRRIGRSHERQRKPRAWYNVAEATCHCRAPACDALPGRIRTNPDARHSDRRGTPPLTRSVQKYFRGRDTVVNSCRGDAGM